MDALTSQSNVAGYKAVLVAAGEFGRFFPLLITAAGTARPAKVLVLGTGVAGLQAIGTARRLGAVVSGYDIRPTSKDEVTSLGATFVELTSVGSAAGEGGYARELTAEERQAQQEELTGHIARQDVVITTLLKRLWRRPASPEELRGFGHLSDMLESWSNETLAQAQHWPDSAVRSRWTYELRFSRLYVITLFLSFQDNIPLAIVA